MTEELFINEKDAWTTWGVNMGDGFLDSLDAPLPMKEYAQDESRLEDGMRIDASNPKVDSREITLGFTITGTSESDYRAKKQAFQAELQKGSFTIRVPVLDEQKYKMIYTGRSISYGLSLDRCFGRFTAKFIEPNPTDRK